jgi:hypothetical protein
MKLDPAYLEQTILAGDAERNIKPVTITDDRSITPYSPFEHSKFSFDLPFFFILKIS